MVKWILLARIATRSAKCGLLLQTAAPIKMPFGRQTRVRQRNQVLDGARDPQQKGHFRWTCTRRLLVLDNGRDKRPVFVPCRRNQ